MECGRTGHAPERRARRRTALAALAAGLGLAAALPAADEGRFLGGTETTYPPWFKNSFLELADDVEEASAAGKRVLILFHQDACPYCNALIERNLSQKDIEQRLRSDFEVVALNLRGDREVVDVGGQVFTEKDFARALNVQFTPTLLFLDASGTIVLRLNGYVPPDELRVALEYASSEAGDVDYIDYLAARRPVSQGAIPAKADLFSAPPYDLRTALGRGKPLAVFFEQSDCPNCDALHAGPLAEAGTTELLGDFHAVQLDMWSDTPVVTPGGEALVSREWARSLGVRYAPTVVLFSPEGREIIRSESYLKQFHFQTVLAYVASGAYREEPDFQRFLTQRADAIRAEGRDVDVWR
jgi:thioredoxin-related protein